MGPRVLWWFGHLFLLAAMVLLLLAWPWLEPKAPTRRSRSAARIFWSGCAVAFFLLAVDPFGFVKWMQD